MTRIRKLFIKILWTIIFLFLAPSCGFLSATPLETPTKIVYVTEIITDHDAVEVPIEVEVEKTVIVTETPFPPTPSPTTLSGATPPPPTPPPDAYDWPMPGANVERTSWSSEEVRGDLKAEWYTHFDAYISQKVQVVAAVGYLFISASDGLHALDAETGDEMWFYATDLPLGHSPTYSDGMVYVGGFDKKIHALDYQTGQLLWSFSADAGFHTNPLVIGDKVFAGNRDGYFYAIYKEGPQVGQLAWKYRTDGPILTSAAYKDSVVFFASNDMHAYALDAQTGSLVWKSAKLPGYGFHSYWPVVYQGYVIFSGTWNYRFTKPGPFGNHNVLERDDVYPPDVEPGDTIGPLGTEPGYWASGTTTIKDSAVTDYFEEKPHRRTYIVLNQSTGREYTFDYDADGKTEYAPILYFGAKGGTRYPPAVGSDGVIYQANNFLATDFIPRGQVTGWMVGTPFISLPTSKTNAVDESFAYSIGGNIVYWQLCCDREAGAFELVGDGEWMYFDQGGGRLIKTLPGLFETGWDFAYWKHGDQSPPIPYNNRVYTINNNAIVAFSAKGLDPISDVERLEDTGEFATDIEKETTITGLNTKVTLSDTTWPLLIAQERYYEHDISDARATYFRLSEVRGSLSTNPSSMSVESTNTGVKITSSFSGGSLETWISQRIPSILFHNTANVYQLREDIVGVAYPTASGVEVKNGSSTFNGDLLSEGWLLVWDDTQEHRWAPMILSLQNRPSEVIVDGNGIRLSYSGSSGYMSLTPLYGMSAPLSSEVISWMSGIPTNTLARIRLLNRVARAFPTSSTDNFSLNANNGDATFTFTYQFQTYSDDWDTSPLHIAFVPSQLALAAWDGSPILVNGSSLDSWTDLTYITPLGRVAGVENTTSVSVTLPGIANYWWSPLSPHPDQNASDPIRQKLIVEIEKMLGAGHLQPGYGRAGIWDGAAGYVIGNNLADHWHNPAETIYTLIRALPLLPSDMQSEVRRYTTSEFQNYPPYEIGHIGWATGQPRQSYDLPPEVVEASADYGACGACIPWGFPPENSYASWLYAKEFGGTSAIFRDIEGSLDPNPVIKQSFSYSLNSYIAGYIGYLNLAALANAGSQSSVEENLVNLLILRAALSKFPNALEQVGFEYGGYQWSLRHFAPNRPDTLFNPVIIGTLWSQMPLYGHKLDSIYGMSGGHTGGGFTFGIDFVNLVPELGDFMYDYVGSEVNEAVADYNTRAPYWFVSEAEELGGEGVIQPLYDVIALFNAKAFVLDASRTELYQYLDVPAVKIGDLYYIQKLVAILEARD